MIKVGKWIAKHKILIIIIGIALLIPSYLGMAATRINYDVLSYLPDTLETVDGQDIMVDQFGMGAFSMIVVEDMELKDVAALKEKIEAVDHVKKVLWYDSVLDVSVPVEMLPKDLREAFFNGDATMMIALFDNTTSSETSMEAVTQIRKITSKNCFVSGMTGIVTDIKQIALKEMPIYVVIASCLSLIVLLLAMDSLVVPVLFLLCIGVAVLYNLGSNIFLGQISYITQALTAVLQLGVTMDYSIFLLNSYEENKKRFEGDKERAMAHAINATFKSVIGSSITTVAGFIALCFMTFSLGRDMGIVMAKGVVIGVLRSPAARDIIYRNSITVFLRYRGFRNLKPGLVFQDQFNIHEPFICIPDHGILKSNIGINIIFLFRKSHSSPQVLIILQESDLNRKGIFPVHFFLEGLCQIRGQAYRYRPLFICDQAIYRLPCINLLVA